MFVQSIAEKEAFKTDSFIKKSSDVYLEQTPCWISFQKKLASRKDAGTLAVFLEKDNFDSIILLASFSVIKTVFGKTYLHINRGPIISNDLKLPIKTNKKAFNLLIEKLKEIAKRNQAIFIRFDFPFNKTDKFQFLDLFLSISQLAHTSFQPGTTLFLDLGKSEEILLSEMHPKGRYNIKLAQKKGVLVRKSAELADLKGFYEILQETASRDGFSIHDFEYYEKMFLELSQQDLLKLYLAEYEGKLIAGSLVAFYHDKATYYYGASKSEYRNVMAPYLLQWQAILDAKNAGFKNYDFLGISGKENEKSSWAGITSFKRKFGGFEVNYFPPREIIINTFFYYLIVILKRVKLFFS